MVNFFQRRRILKSTSSLDLIPIRKLDHAIDETEQTINILLPKFKNEQLRRFFVPRNKAEFIQIKLDKIGSAAWLLMDGKKDVKQICDELEVQFGETVKPIEERINKFLTGLYNNRYISFKQLEG